MLYGAEASEPENLIVGFEDSCASWHPSPSHGKRMNSVRYIAKSQHLVDFVASYDDLSMELENFQVANLYVGSL